MYFQHAYINKVTIYLKLTIHTSNDISVKIIKKTKQNDFKFKFLVSIVNLYL